MYDLGIPRARANAPQGLTHSPDLTRKGLAMHATRELPTRRRVTVDPHPDLAEAVTVSRFWRLVQIGDPDACWPWLGDSHHDGYGIFFYRGRRRGAHEMALSFSTGEARHPSLDTCHSCDNPACCNPAHLRFDTRGSNVREMHDRGRDRNGTPKLAADQIVLIRERRALGARQQDLAEEFGVSNGLISMIVRGLRWPSVGGPIQPRKAA